MKLNKREKLWLGSVLFFFIMYNMPFLPGYNNTAGTLVHGALTLIPLWICVYVGLFKISDANPSDTMTAKLSDDTSVNTSSASCKEDPTC